MKAKTLVLLPLLVCLIGCFAGSVKPLLDRPEFKTENEPIRTLRILLITDNSYRRDEIEKFVSKCSRLVERQVGIQLEILNWHQIQWGDELQGLMGVPNNPSFNNFFLLIFQNLLFIQPS